MNSLCEHAAVSNRMATLEDVNPRVGPIPAAAPLPPTSLGKNHFKVDLLVHGNAKEKKEEKSESQLMLPFLQFHHRDAPLSTDYYVATPGLPFSIRVKLARSASEGVLYGARVYIDSGETDRDMAFKSWSDDTDDEDEEDEENEVDTSKADHYFWFTPGSTEHVIHGFYKSPTQSQQFVFAEPSKKRLRDCDHGTAVDLVESAREINSFGVIRIMICRVEGFQKRSDRQLQREQRAQRSPKKQEILESVDKKIELVAEPGPIVQDGADPERQEAVLSNEIVYERRVAYNSFEGWNARRMFARCTSHVDFYKGMPLSALLQSNIRRQAIMAFFRNVSAERVDLSERQTLEAIDQTERPAVAGTNDFVRVEDIVHYICESLSPAGSYIICTGKSKKESKTSGVLVHNYGERNVQKTRASKREKFQDYAEKERQLVAFLQSEPGVYDLEFVGRDKNRLPNENYKVKLAVLEIGSSDEDSGEVTKSRMNVLI